MTKHPLKILEKYWGPIQNGQKTCEIRKDDRSYKVGDQIEFIVIADDGSGPLSYKNSPPYEITHVLYFPEGLRDGYKALSIRKIYPQVKTPVIGKFEEIKKDLASVNIELGFFPPINKTPGIYFNPISVINGEVNWEFISIT